MLEKDKNNGFYYSIRFDSIQKIYDNIYYSIIYQMRYIYSDYNFFQVYIYLYALSLYIRQTIIILVFLLYLLDA